MKAGTISLLLLTMSAATAFAQVVSAPGAVTPLPLRLEPSLIFDGEPQMISDWIFDGVTHPGYIVGMAKASGASGENVLAILAGPGADDRGGAMRVATSIDAWRGKRVRLSARLKSEGVERLQMWLRVMGPEPTQMRRYNMAERPIRGTQDWQPVEIVMDVPGDAKSLTFGLYVEGGKGKAFGDDFRLEAVGPEVTPDQLAGLDDKGWQKAEFGTPVSRALVARQQALERSALARARTRQSVWPSGTWLDSSPQNGQLGHYEMELQLEKARTPPHPGNQ